MKQFNIEDYNTGKYDVVTRGGLPVRILCTDAKLVNGEMIVSISSSVVRWNFHNGRYNSNGIPGSTHDLFLVEKEVITEFFKGVSPDSHYGLCYSSFEEALNGVDKDACYGIIKHIYSSTRGLTSVEIVHNFPPKSTLHP